jgi:hypothetical protein
MGHWRQLCCSSDQGPAAIDHHGLSCVRPDLKVHAMVARVVKAFFAKPLNQSVRLAAPRQVASAIAGHHAIEQLRVRSDRMHQPLV